MFYKIKLNQYPMPNDFKNGFGFYLVTYTQTPSLTSDVHIWNPKTNVNFSLGFVYDLPTEFLELFENKKEVVEDTTEDTTTHKVTEDFALKMLAISRANANQIKVTELL